ncbi:MAG: glycosyltransferase [Candidatus Omnitrophica bacterium]|nr:glycosyltransferase [Candidatus Omnitrophota bacterium]
MSRPWLRHGTALLGAETAILLLRLGLAVVVMRCLDAEAFGQFTYVRAIVAVAALTALPGMLPAVTRAVARGDEGTLRTGWLAMVRSAVWGAAVLALMAGWYAFVRPLPVMALCFGVAAAGFIITSTTELFRAFWEGRGWFGSAAWRVALQHLGIMGATALAAWLSRSLVWTLAASVIATIVIQSWLQQEAFRRSRPTPAEPEAVAYGRQLTRVSWLSLAAAHVDKLLIAHLLGFPSLAVYALAALVADQARRFGNITVTLLFPTFARLEGPAASQWLNVHGGRLALGYGAFVTAGIVAAPWVVPRCFGPTYQSAVVYVQWMLAVTWCELSSGFISKVLLTTQERPRELTRLAGVGLVSQAGWFLWLIPRWGMWGAMWGNALAALSVLAYAGWLAHGLSRAPRVSATDRPVRLLHLIVRLGIGGAERQLLTWLAHRDRRRYDVTIGYLDGEAPLRSAFERAGARVIGFGMRGPWDASVAWRLWRHFRHHRYDIVHTHGFRADVWGGWMAYAAGVRAVLSTKHNEDQYLRRPWWAALARRTAAMNTRVVAISAAVERFLIEVARLNPAKLVRIPYGLTTNGVAPNDMTMLARPTIGAIGRLVPQKGFGDLLEALPSLRAEFPSLRTLIVGDGPLRQRLESQAARLGLTDCVELTGWQEPIEPVLAQTDVVVLPSLWEGFGLVLAEAMQCGKPVVASRVGGIPELVIDGETGLLVPSADAAALAHALRRILRDRAWAEQLGRAGRHRVAEQFPVGRMVEQLDTLYMEALNRP